MQKPNSIKRGRALEKSIEACNQYYKKEVLAFIFKQHIPLEYIKDEGLNYIRTHKAPVDYTGVVQGRAIAVEAKETENTSSFPLRNIKSHQLKFLKFWYLCGGEAFFIIHFKKKDKDFAYKVPFEFIESYWEKCFEKKGRKSIPYKDFINLEKIPLCDYLNLKKNRE